MEARVPDAAQRGVGGETLGPRLLRQQQGSPSLMGLWPIVTWKLLPDACFMVWVCTLDWENMLADCDKYLLSVTKDQTKRLEVVCFCPGDLPVWIWPWEVTWGDKCKGWEPWSLVQPDCSKSSGRLREEHDPFWTQTSQLINLPTVLRKLVSPRKTPCT